MVFCLRFTRLHLLLALPGGVAVGMLTLRRRGGRNASGWTLCLKKTSCLENSGGCEIECHCMSHPAVVCFIFSSQEVICKEFDSHSKELEHMAVRLTLRGLLFLTLHRDLHQ